MSIRRAARKTTYTNVDNHVFEAGLSYRAMGLLCFLLSKPDHWEVSTTHLINSTKNSANPLGKDAIYSILKELKDAGFVTSEQLRGEDGKMGKMDYIIHDTPQQSKPEADKPEAAEPHAANPPQVNTESLVSTEKAVTTEREPAREEATPEQLETLFNPSTDDRRKFTMSFDWRPEGDRIKARMQQMAIPILPPSEYRQSLIAFQNHFEASGLRQTESQWIAKLMSWIQGDLRNKQAKALSQPVQPSYKPFPKDD